MKKEQKKVKKVMREFKKGTLKIGGSDKKVKKKKSFPDVSGDGKITKKDILMARGVIPKTKNGMKKKRK